STTCSSVLCGGCSIRHLHSFPTRRSSDLPVAVGGAVAEMIDNSQYTMVYPEDIDMFGISFSSNVGPVALSGEVAYRPKQPIINDVGDNLVAGLARAAGASATQNATNEKATEA